MIQEIYKRIFLKKGQSDEHMDWWSQILQIPVIQIGGYNRVGNIVIITGF